MGRMENSQGLWETIKRADWGKKVIGGIFIVILLVLFIYAYINPAFLIFVIVLLAGMLGGFVNAVITGDGDILLPDWTPKPTQDSKGMMIRLGVVGNIIIGASAAVISFGLYSSFTTLPIISLGNITSIVNQTAEAAGETGQTILFTLGDLTGSFLIGIGGSRWLTKERDSRINDTTFSLMNTLDDTERGEVLSESTPSNRFTRANKLATRKITAGKKS